MCLCRSDAEMALAYGTVIKDHSEKSGLALQLEHVRPLDCGDQLTHHLLDVMLVHLQLTQVERGRDKGKREGGSERENGNECRVKRQRRCLTAAPLACPGPKTARAAPRSRCVCQATIKCPCQRPALSHILLPCAPHRQCAPPTARTFSLATCPGMSSALSSGKCARLCSMSCMPRARPCPSA